MLHVRNDVTSEADVQILMTGLVFGEQPRWHEDRLWFSDWGPDGSLVTHGDLNRLSG
jgi:hypothetical protein